MRSRARSAKHWAVGGAGANEHMVGGPWAVYDYGNGNLEVYFSAQGTLSEYYFGTNGWSPLVTIGGTVS